MQIPKDPRSGAAAFAGIALIAFGAWRFVSDTGIIPPGLLDLIGDAAGALTLIALGIVVLLVARRGEFTVPRSGTRLYRSRDDRWLGGVLGGLGRYLGVDPLVLRLATVLLTILGAGSFVIAYIVLWVLVPEEPLTVETPASTSSTGA